MAGAQHSAQVLRAAPAQVASRQRSRSAFASLGASAAISLATHTFGLGQGSWTSPLVTTEASLLHPPAFRGTQRGPGRTGARSTHAPAQLAAIGAPVMLANHKHALIESPTPLLTPSAGGAKPVDLDLRRVAGGFAPVRPVVAAVFSSTLSAGVTLAGGMRLAPASSGAPHPVQVANRLVFANALRDTDVIEQPIPQGIETSWVLRSQLAPRVLATRLALPAGATLTQDRVIPGAVDLVRGSAVLLRAMPVSAKDADGVPVPAHYVISGSRLIVEVDSGHDIRFPVLVDPAFVETSGYFANGPGAPTYNPWAGWVTGSNGAPGYAFAQQAGGAANPYLGSAYYSFVSAALSPAANTAGGWIVSAPNYGQPGGTAIVRADLSGVHYNTSGHSGFAAYTGAAPGATQPIWTQNGYAGAQGVQPFLSTTAFSISPWGLAFCAQNGGGTDNSAAGLCNYSIGAPYFAVSIYAPVAGANSYDYAWFGGASVSVSDPTPPDQVSLTGIPPGWVRSGPANAVVTGHDQGLGVFYLDVEGQPGTPVAPGGYGTCGYSQVGLPAAQPCQYAGSATVDLSGLPEGAYPLSGTAYDAALNPSRTPPQTIKIDRTPPTGSLGALPATVRQTVLVSGNTADAPAPGASASSGVGHIDLWVMAQGGSWQLVCGGLIPDGTGRFTCNWNTAAGTYPDGSYTVAANIYDVAGNFAQTQSATIVSNMPPSSVPGAPSSVQATAGDASADVTWTAPSSNGSPIDHYTVSTYKASDNSQVGQPVAVNAPATSAHITGLTNGTANYFKVTAHNAVGDGPAGTSNTITPQSGGGGGGGGGIRCYSQDHCWGLDNSSPVTGASLDQITQDYGRVDFFGRYFTSGGGPMAFQQSEVAPLHDRGDGVLLLADLHGACASASDGTAEATAAAKAGGTFSIPANDKITFFLDIEGSSAVSSACLRAYADGIEAQHYRAGFYANPLSGDSFEPQFCAATNDAHVAHAVLWSPVPSSDTSSYAKSQSPSFNPTHVSCSGGTMSVWQYRLQGTGSVPYDADELDPSAKDVLWLP